MKNENDLIKQAEDIINTYLEKSQKPTFEEEINAMTIEELRTNYKDIHNSFVELAKFNDKILFTFSELAKFNENILDTIKKQTEGLNQNSKNIKELILAVKDLQYSRNEITEEIFDIWQEVNPSHYEEKEKLENAIDEFHKEQETQKKLN